MVGPPVISAQGTEEREDIPRLVSLTETSLTERRIEDDERPRLNCPGSILETRTSNRDVFSLRRGSFLPRVLLGILLQYLKWLLLFLKYFLAVVGQSRASLVIGPGGPFLRKSRGVIAQRNSR